MTTKSEKTWALVILAIVAIVFLCFCIVFLCFWLENAKAYKVCEIETENLRKKVVEKDAVISSLKTENEKITLLNQEIAEKDTVISKLMTEIEKSGTEKDEKVSKLKSEIAMLKNMVKTKEQDYKDLWGGINARDRIISQLENQLASQVETEIVTEDIPIIPTTTRTGNEKLNIFVNQDAMLVLVTAKLQNTGIAFWDQKKSKTVELKNVLPKNKLSILMNIFNHNRKIKGTFDEVNSSLIFQVNLSHFPDRYFEVAFSVGDRYWELTETGYSSYLYIDQSVGRYGYNFQIDENGNIISHGNQ